MKQKSLRRLILVLTAAALIFLFLIPSLAGATQKSDSPPQSIPDEDEETDSGDGYIERNLLAAIDKDLIEFEDDVEGEDDDFSFDPDSIDITGADLANGVCMSVGKSSRGRLINGVQLKPFSGLSVRPSGNNWATPETVAGLRYAIAKLRQDYPDAPEIFIGDISKEGGGRLKRHKSHQSGRDVDASYFLKGQGRLTQLVNASESTLDVERTWAFIDALLEDGKVQYIFIDYRLQRPLYNYVKYKKKAPESYLEKVFSYPSGPRSNKAIIRHARGHVHHMHVRFHSPIAVAAARNFHFQSAQLDRLKGYADSNGADENFAPLASMEQTEWGPPPQTEIVQQWKNVKTSYRIRKGETLGLIAKRNGVAVSQLMKWNKLSKKSTLKPGKSLVIYKRKLVEVEVPVIVPDADAPSDIQSAVAAPVPATPDTAALKTAAANPEESGRYDWVTIQNGDNLWKIANQNQMTVDQLRELNGIKGKRTLRVGEKLKIRVSTGDSMVSRPKIGGAGKTAVAVKGFQTVSEPDESGESFRYVITRGDNLYSLSQRFNLKVSTLCRWNKLSAGAEIKPGETLVMYLPKSDTAMAKAEEPESVKQAGL